jgi:2-methylaconitate cis-trans-isomerase PrpF
MQRRIPTAYMRGGTSKGLFFHAKDIPEEPRVRDRVILAAYGSPDPENPLKPDPNRRQVNGMGGGSYTSSLLSIIRPVEDPEYDVGWTFGLVSVDEPVIDYKGKSCGNIPSAVACFAIEEGLVPPVEPLTSVRILHENSGKLIIADVPVKDGRYNDEGDYTIDGVPGTGGKITLRFRDPGGEITGKLFPTGKATDVMSVPGVGDIPVSIVDAINPIVFLRAADLGLQGTEIHEIDHSKEIRDKLEAIRGRGAVMLGMAFTPEDAARTSKDMPKIAFVSKPRDYETVKGRLIRKEEIDMVARIIWKG